MKKNSLRSAAIEIFNAAGVADNIQTITPTLGGRNNRGYNIDNGDTHYFAKLYYHSPLDPRNRLRSEYDFLLYAWNCGIRSIPKPIGCLPEEHFAIYSFIEGEKINAHDIALKQIDAAAKFIHQLNIESGRGHTLPTASEAAFNIEDHIAIIDQRIQNLSAIVVKTNIDHQVKLLIVDIENAWNRVRCDLATNTMLNTPLSSDDYCISPSDFGFHNILVTTNGGLRFLDFEYAGWDDPAKMCCDFFCQPEIPVPLQYFDCFVQTALDYSNNSQALTARSRAMLPLFHIKWCCIMLNEFLPNGMMRRTFSESEDDIMQKQQNQLKKTRMFLAQKAHKTFCY
ncbi:MAG: aminoglycoside phosphotransferase family protein [Mariprofundales bacterium]